MKRRYGQALIVLILMFSLLLSGCQNNIESQKSEDNMDDLNGKVVTMDPDPKDDKPRVNDDKSDINDDKSDTKKDNQPEEIPHEESVEDTQSTDDKSESEQAAEKDYDKSLDQSNKANHDKNKDDEEKIVIENEILGFNNLETKKLRDLVCKIGASLIEDDNQEDSNVDVNSLEAIAIFENKDSYGWITKYGDNKIGVAMMYHETPIELVRLFGEKAIFQSDASGITNNDPEQYKQASEIIEKTVFEADTTIQRLY